MFCVLVDYVCLLGGVTTLGGPHIEGLLRVSCYTYEPASRRRCSGIEETQREFDAGKEWIQAKCKPKSEQELETAEQ